MKEDEVIACLNRWGCDTKGALERTLDDSGFYVSLLLEYKDSFELRQLKEFIEQNDAEKAFEVAHTLKGVLGNLGLTPLYRLCVQIVEPLRAGHCEGLAGLAQQLIDKKAEMDELLKEACSGQ